MAALSEARKLQPNDVKTNFSLAEAYAGPTSLDKAEETYKTLVGLNPEGATTYYGKIIQMYDEAGQYDKAIEAARKIIEINPKNELAVFNLGIMFLKLQRIRRGRRGLPGRARPQAGLRLRASTISATAIRWPRDGRSPSKASRSTRNSPPTTRWDTSTSGSAS